MMDCFESYGFGAVLGSCAAGKERKRKKKEHWIVDKSVSVHVCVFLEGCVALVPATCSDISPCASHRAPMLQVDVLHSTISIWLANQFCLGRPYPSHARPLPSYSLDTLESNRWGYPGCW